MHIGHPVAGSMLSAGWKYEFFLMHIFVKNYVIKYMERGEKSMELKERVKSFMYDTGAKLSVFCRKVEISPTYYYAWMRGEVEFSEAINNRITVYLNEVYAK